MQSTALLFMPPKYFLVAGSYCALVFIYVSNLLYVTVLQCTYLFPCRWTFGLFPMPPDHPLCAPFQPNLLRCPLHTSQPPPGCAPKILLTNPFTLPWPQLYPHTHNFFNLILQLFFELQAIQKT